MATAVHGGLSVRLQGFRKVQRLAYECAEAVAARARKDYLRAHTRHEALVTLAANRQSEERRRYERVDSVEVGE